MSQGPAKHFMAQKRSHQMPCDCVFFLGSCKGLCLTVVVVLTRELVGHLDFGSTLKEPGAGGLEGGLRICISAKFLGVASVGLGTPL